MVVHSSNNQLSKSFSSTAVRMRRPMLKVMSTSCLKPYLAPVVFSVVGCASFTVWLGKIMELLVHQDLKFPLKCKKSVFRFKIS